MEVRLQLPGISPLLLCGSQGLIRSLGLVANTFVCWLLSASVWNPTKLLLSNSKNGFCLAPSPQ